MDKTKYLASGELLVAILLVLREYPRVQHGSVGGGGAVLPAEHPEGKLGVVDHRGDDQLGPAQPRPVSPGPFDARISSYAQTPSRRRQRRRRRCFGGLLSGLVGFLVAA